MKNLFLILLLNSISLTCFSQFKLLDEGSEFTYSMSSMIKHGTETLTITGDSVLISDKYYKVMERHLDYYDSWQQVYDTSLTIEYVRSENLEIFWYDQQDEVEKKLYDFNLKEGDTIDFLDLKYFSSNSVTMEVTSATQSELNGEEILKQSIKVSGPFPNFTIPINSKYGCSFQSFFINELGDLWGDIPYYKLCKFSSPHFGVITTNFSQCESILTSADLLLKSLNFEPKIYPNPASDELIIETEFNESYNVVITDLTGAKILKENISPGVGSIKLNGIANGIYYIQFFSLDEHKSSLVQKLFVMK